MPKVQVSLNDYKPNELHRKAFELYYVRKSDEECWIWNGSLNSSGYGRFCLGNNIRIGAHRLAYYFHYGIIDDSLLVLHKCDNPPCINPYHLFQGTDQDNTQDCISKGRFKQNLITKDGTSHESHTILTDEQVLLIVECRRAGNKLSTIAKAFKISEAQVSRLANGLQRKYLTRLA